MLAQNFKTPSALSLSATEHRALVMTLGMLERQEVRHGKFRGCSAGGAPSAFQMVTTTCATDCGTACCILGWARHLAGDDDLFRRPKDEDLEDLFAMGGDDTSKSWLARAHHGTENITPDQAAIALRNYLTTGKPRWDEALSG